MKKTYARLAFLAALAACGSDPPLDPVDMVFRTEVIKLENTCASNPPTEGARVMVDARLHADGTVELVSRSSWVPGPGSFPDVRVIGDRVDYRADRYSSTAGKTYPYRIEGSLSMAGMDLTVEERWFRVTVGGHEDCVHRARLIGEPRAFRDREALDGRYSVGLSYEGEVCQGQPWPSEPSNGRVFLLDADPREEVMYLNLDGMIYAGTDLPDAADALRWDGTLYIVDHELGIIEAPGGLHGQFRPDGVYLGMEFQLPWQAPECRHRYLMDGYKRTAGRSRGETEYRAVIRERDGCNGKTRAYEDHQVFLLEQSMAEMEVRDPYGDWFIDFDGTVLHEADGSEAEGFKAVFDGRIEPPFLTYTLAYSLQDFEGNWCDIAYDVDAVVRFVPEVEWTPAFLPDEEEEPASATARLSQAPQEAIPPTLFAPK